MTADVYAPPLPSSSGHWCTMAFIQRGVRPEIIDNKRMVFIRIFGPGAEFTAARLKPGQGRLLSVQWSEPGVIYPRSAGPAVLLNIELPGEAKPKYLTIEALVGKKVITMPIRQTVDIDYMYSNLSKPIPADKTPRTRVQHSGKWLEASWDGWFRRSGRYAVQESRKVGNSLWQIGLQPVAKK